MNPIRRDETVELKYNKGTWHIFHPTHPRKQKCLCGSTEKDQYKRNHGQKKRTADKVLEDPDTWLGHVCPHGLRKLENLIQEWDKLQTQRQVKA